MDLRKLSDEKLVEYIQKNAGDGFELIIDRYQDSLLRYAQRLSGRLDLSEEAVQESFLSVYENVQSFDTKRKFSSWIYRIAHNKVINIFKKESKTLNLGEKTDIPDESIKIKIEDKIDLEKHKEILDKVINLVPLRYKEIIVLRFFEDKSYEEISEICKCPISTVGVRISRGLKIIKDRIKMTKEEL